MLDGRSTNHAALGKTTPTRLDRGRPGGPGVGGEEVAPVLAALGLDGAEVPPSLKGPHVTQTNPPGWKLGLPG